MTRSCLVIFAVWITHLTNPLGGGYNGLMKKYMPILLVFFLFITLLLGFNADSARAYDSGTICPNGNTIASNCSMAPTVLTGQLCPNGMTLASNCTSGNSTLNDSSVSETTSTFTNTLFKRELGVGSKGEDVKAIQQILKNSGLLSGNVDGSYGPITEGAVRRYQTTNNLSATGKVDASTFERIKMIPWYRMCPVINSIYGVEYPCPSAPVTPTSPVISGVSGPHALDVNQQGTWTVTAYDRNGGNLSYSVNWGDSSLAVDSLTGSIAQRSTFTHSYKTAGIYNPTFTVTSQNTINCITTPCPTNGGSAQTSLSVNVGNTTNPSIITVLAGPINNPNNGHQYYFLSPATWQASEDKAVELGGHLATIHDKSESDWLTKQFTNWEGTARYPWIGLNDMKSEGSWVWSNGEPVTYSNWAPGEPNSGAGIYDQEDAVHLWGAIFTPGTWNDAQEGLTYEGIVEIGTDKVDTTNIVSEQVKCVFSGSDSDTNQSCYTTNRDGKYYTFSGTEGTVSGYKGETLTWKSSCGGYAYTTMDGENEYARFTCDSDSGSSINLKVNGSDFPSAVEYGSVIEASWGSTGIDISETECKMGGHYVPTTDGRFWTDLSDQKPNGVVKLYAKHATFGYVSPLILTITCFDGIKDYSDSVSVTVKQSAQPSITVISPNGGETRQTGSSQTIRWNVGTDSSIRYVNFELRTSPVGSAGVTGRDLYLQAPNTGSLTFTLPSSYPVGTYFLQIKKTDETLLDESDSFFTITSPVSTTPTLSFEIDGRSDAFSVAPGSSITPEWETANATRCANNWDSDASVRNRGTQSFSPTESKTYTITCYSSNGVSVSKSIRVEVASTNTGLSASAISVFPSFTTTSNITGAGKFYFTQWLDEGSSGNEVIELQKFLNNAGYYSGAIDGKFGFNTKESLIRFQTANGLKGDGIVGYEVRSFLNR